jgi:hypothetical protein
VIEVEDSESLALAAFGSLVLEVAKARGWVAELSEPTQLERSREVFV